MNQIEVKKYTLRIDNVDVDFDKLDSKKKTTGLVDISPDKKTQIGYKQVTTGVGSTQTTINLKLYLSLSGLTFNRKIYEPGHIDAVIQVTLPDDKDAPTITELQKTFLRKKVALLLNVNTVKNPYTLAENYYIQEISPRYEKSGQKTSIYVGLSIYSMDNLMRLDKYSDAYLGRRLCYDILTLGATDFKLNVKDTNSKTYSISTQVDQLQYLQVIDTKKYIKEFIQPYLVQYNESFYDFVARTANRCGEFLYFEDGTLHVGLEENKLNNVKPIDNYSRLTYQSISEGALDVKLYTHDSRKNAKWKIPDTVNWGKTSTPEKGDFNTTPWHLRKGGDVKPNDNPYPTNPVYNAEVTSDEFYMPLYRNQFSKGNKEELWADEAVGTQVVDIISSMLNMTSLVDMFWTKGTELATAAVKAEMNSDSANDKGNAIIDQYAPLDAETGRQEKDAKVAIPFVNASTSTDSYKDDNDETIQRGFFDKDATCITLEYYKDIKSKEESQQRQMVCVEMGTNYKDLKLGDVVKFDSDDNRYVIVQIDMLNDQTMTFHAIPAITDSSKPKATYSYYPPVLPTAPFRLSEPQHAIVVDNSDPYQQGRVRIRYPWQMDIETRKKKFTKQKNAYKTEKQTIENEIDSVLKKIKNDIDDTLGKYLETKEKYERQLERLKDNDTTYIKDNYKDYKSILEELKIEVTDDEKDNKKLSDEHREAIINKLKDDIAEYKSKIETKEGSLKSDKKTNYDNIIKNELQPLRDKIINKLKDITFMELNEAMADAATPWIRMATPMATEGGGMFFRPEKGDEVLVNFECGNVERPYVVGTLYTKHVPAPKASRIIKSPNGHYIKMDDPKDGYKFLASWLPGIKFAQGYHLITEDDESMKNRYTHMLGGITMTDAYGLYKISMSSHDRKIAISSPLGDIKMDAFTGITINAPNGNIKIAGKNVDISANNRLTITSGKNIKKGLLGPFSFFDEKSRKPSLISKGAANIINDVGNQIFGNLIDLSFLRSIIEVILRPVNGTLEIKSNSFLLLEAGGSSAQIPATAYSKFYYNAHDALSNSLSAYNNGFKGFDRMMNVLMRADIAAKAYEFKKLFDNIGIKLSNLTTELRPNSGKNTIFSGGHNLVTNKTPDQFVDACFTTDSSSVLIDTTLTWRNMGGDKNIWKAAIKAAYDAIQELKKFCVNIRDAKLFTPITSGLNFDLYNLLDKRVTATFDDTDLNGITWVKFIQDVHRNQAGIKTYSNYVTVAQDANNHNIYTPIKFELKEDVLKQDVAKVKRCLIFHIFTDQNKGYFNNSSAARQMNLQIKNVDTTPVTPTALKKHAADEQTRDLVNPKLTTALTDVQGTHVQQIDVQQPQQATKKNIIDNEDDAWAAFVNTIELEARTDNGFGEALEPFVTPLVSGAWDNICNKMALFSEKGVWSSDTKGQILMADGNDTISITHPAGGTPTLDAFPSQKTSPKDIKEANLHIRKLLIKIGQ